MLMVLKVDKITNKGSGLKHNTSHYTGPVPTFSPIKRLARFNQLCAQSMLRFYLHLSFYYTTTYIVDFAQVRQKSIRFHYNEKPAYICAPTRFLL